MAYAGAGASCAAIVPWTSTGIILVLFILLVIVSRAWLPGI